MYPQPRRYFEIDFPEVTGAKARIIWTSKKLKDLVGDCTIAGGGTELVGSDYFLIGGDLRHFEEQLGPKMKSLGFDSRWVLDWVIELTLQTANPVPLGMLSHLSASRQCRCNRVKHAC